MTFGGIRSCFSLGTVTASLWKSERPVSKVQVLSKLFAESIQEGKCCQYS